MSTHQLNRIMKSTACTTVFIFSFSLCALIALSQTMAASIIKTESYRTFKEPEFVISVPKNREKVSLKTLQSYVRSLRAGAPNVDPNITHFEYAYQPIGNEDVLSLPAVIIQIQQGSKDRPDDL